MNLKHLSWTRSPKRVTVGGIQLGFACADDDFSFLEDAVGVDPGRNFGVSFIRDGELFCYWGKLDKEERDLDYFFTADRFMTAFIKEFGLCAEFSLVEGPSYGSPYKQPMLEDVRLGFFVALNGYGMEPDYIAPQSARKQVFGHGRTKANELWDDIDENGADSVPICLLAGGWCL